MDVRLDKTTHTYNTVLLRTHVSVIVFTHLPQSRAPNRVSLNPYWYTLMRMVIFVKLFFLTVMLSTVP
jgi:hypothetical protein